jgi:hypothetical protein
LESIHYTRGLSGEFAYCYTNLGLTANKGSISTYGNPGAKGFDINLLAGSVIVTDFTGGQAYFYYR